MGAPVRIAAVAVVVAMATTARAAVLERTPAGMYTAGQPLPVLSSSIDVRVQGPFAEATVTQRFRNPLDHAIEAVYVFPLPDDAAVSSMVIHAGSRTITARVEDRRAARERYEAAVAAGTAGALLEEERPDVFTQAVTAIPPGAEISVELRWDTSVTRRSGTWELALPLVVGPRYAPGTPTGTPSKGSGYAPDTDRAPDASRVTPESGPDGVPVAIHVHLDARAAIDAVEVPTHDATVELHGKTAEIAVADARSDRDLVVRWRTKTDVPTAITDAAGFVAIVVPAPATAKAPPRDWIVVADTSKSTSGDGLVLVKRAVRALVDHVGARDRVAIAGAVALGTPAGARAWIDRASADGASDLAASVKTARALAKKATRPVIVLVTDGLVADDAEVYAAAAGGPPILAVGVGAAPNRGLLDGLAARTGGGARYLGAADDAEAIATALVAQADAPRPAATTIAWGGLVTDAVPAQIPALAPGDAAIVIAKVDQPRKARVAVAASALDLPAVWDAQPSRPDAVAPASVIARRWARGKLDALVASGGGADDVRALGLRYGLVTPETALVAVGSDVVVKGGVSTSVDVPVAMPAGMRWQAVFGADGDARDAHAPHKEPADDADKPKDQLEKSKGKVDVTSRPTEPTDTSVQGATTTGEVTGRAGGEGAVTAPAPVREAENMPGAAYDAEELVLTSAIAERRWGFAFELGAGALIAPSRDAVGLVSLRAVRGLTPTTGVALDVTALAAPGADRDRVAVALMAALVRGGFLDGRLTFDLGVGPELASDPGLGYEVGARWGLGRVGFVVRWDGALLFGDGGAFHRGSATAGVQVGF